MKKLLSLLLAACLLFSCAQADVLQDLMHKFFRDTVIFGGTEYSGGFYGDLYPQVPPSGNAFRADGESFFRIDHPEFDLICREQTAVDEILCKKSQWQAAADYYANSANFTYYCLVGAQYTDRTPVLLPLPGMDTDMFDRLMAFAAENEYNPFGKAQTGEHQRLPMPDRDASPQLVFYKESKDGLFASGRGHKFHIIDGKLFMVYRYDFNFGEKEELIAAEVPPDLARYFISITENNTI